MDTEEIPLRESYAVLEDHGVSLPTAASAGCETGTLGAIHATSAPEEAISSAQDAHIAFSGRLQDMPSEGPAPVPSMRSPVCEAAGRETAVAGSREAQFMEICQDVPSSDMHTAAGAHENNGRTDLWAGDPLEQLQDALLQALASVREDIVAQLAQAGMHVDGQGRHLIIKRAQLLLYCCRLSVTPTVAQLGDLRLLELASAVLDDERLTALWEPCDALLRHGVWGARARALGLQPPTPVKVEHHVDSSFPAEVQVSTREDVDRLSPQTAADGGAHWGLPRQGGVDASVVPGPGGLPESKLGQDLVEEADAALRAVSPASNDTSNAAVAPQNGMDGMHAVHALQFAT